MASGWWKSTHTNLAEVSPVDFAVTTAPQAPRGFPKLASIATGAGLFLGGTPSVVVDDVLYYAGDDYTQDTHKPTLNRYDGQIHTEVLELPYLTGTTPSKAILSLCADSTGRIYISTWDSGTTSSDFVGRVYAYSGGALTRVDGGLFTGGKLPYTMVWFNDALYIGVSKQDPASTTEVIKLPVDGGLPTGPSPTCTLTGTTYTYRVAGFLTAYSDVGSPSGKSAPINVLNRATLGGGVYNTLSWDTPASTVYFRHSRLAGGVTQREIWSQNVPMSTLNDTGLDQPNADQTNVGSQNITLTVAPVPAQATTSTYRIGAIVNGFEFLSAAVNVTTGATLYSDLYVALSWSTHTDATSYRIYRTAGHSSQGLIGTTASTTFSDTGIAATTAVPSTYSSIALTSGAVSAMVVYGSDLYIGSYQPSGTFGKVFKITTGDVLSTSNTAAPGGTAQAYNGYTAGIVFGANLYMGYWNDDATDVCAIHKYTGSSWSVVKTISGAGARPWMCFAEADSTVYGYGGGDAKTGILYETTDGTTWTDVSGLLPSSKEAIPFIGTVNVVGGF